MWIRKKAFLAPAGSRVVGLGKNQRRPPAKNNWVFNQIEAEWQNWNQMLADRRQVTLCSMSLTVRCVCVFFSMGPGGVDLEPQRGGLPGAVRHYPVSALFQRHKPGAAPRHYADFCGEFNSASHQAEEKIFKLSSWTFQPLISQRQRFLLLKTFSWEK